jgi:hypothetical protein
MTVITKTALALAFLAIPAVQPAFADEALAGANNLRAAYQAEGVGATDFGANRSTDAVPTVETHTRIGGIAIVSHTDAGLARLLGIGDQSTAASMASNR